MLFAKLDINAKRFPSFAPSGGCCQMDVKECKMGELPLAPKWRQPMTPAGSAPVAARQKTGKWTKYSTRREGMVTLDPLIK